MEQFIQEEEKRRKICERIEEQYQVKIFQQKVKDNMVFTLKKAQDMIQLVSYSAAMRRNPPLPGANRLPCMADFIRVDTCLMAEIQTQQADAECLLKSALQYQYDTKLPFTCITASEMSKLGEAKQFGFHCIYEHKKVKFSKLISEEMLRQANEGLKVKIMPIHMELCALDHSQLVSLAHFSNAMLCRKYGLFMIRSAVYFEKLQQECQSCQGNIYVLQEKGKIKGYFVYMAAKGQQLQEVLLEEGYLEELLIEDIGQKTPAMYARIVNLKEMLRHISSHGKVSIAIRIIDPVMKENDGLFVWYLSEAGSYLDPIEEQGAMTQKPELTVTIGELTAFLFEYKKLKENIKFDSIYLSGPAFLTELC